MLLWNLFKTHFSSAPNEADMKRLAAAEEELVDLRVRRVRACDALDDRQRRNHWRESIEYMIQGAR